MYVRMFIGLRLSKTRYVTKKNKSTPWAVTNFWTGYVERVRRVPCKSTMQNFVVTILRT